MKVHWTDRAKTRLKLIHDYIAQDAPLVATQVVERLIRRSQQIGKLPHTGRAVPESGWAICKTFWWKWARCLTSKSPYLSALRIVPTVKYLT